LSSAPVMVKVSEFTFTVSDGQGGSTTNTYVSLYFAPSLQTRHFSGGHARAPERNIG
jgi:hypothetical protein